MYIHAEQDVVVQVVPVQSGGSRREEGKERADDGGVEEKEPPKKKAKVMLLQVRKKGKVASGLPHPPNNTLHSPTSVCPIMHI